jgi:hypothetical protein
LMVDTFSSAPRFHLCAVSKSFAGAEPGTRFEVEGNFGRLTNGFAASGSGVIPPLG